MHGKIAGSLKDWPTMTNMDFVKTVNRGIKREGQSYRLQFVQTMKLTVKSKQKVAHSESVNLPVLAVQIADDNHYRVIVGENEDQAMSILIESNNVYYIIKQ